MNCPVVRDLLAPYIDLELSGETQAQIDEHLSKCESCTLELQAQLGVHRLLSEKLDRAEACEELKRQIIENTVGQSTIQSMWFLRKFKIELRPITGIAIAAMLILAVFSKDLLTENTPVMLMSDNFQLSNSSLLPSEAYDGLKATVVGELMCIGCHLNDQFKAKHDCEMLGHKIVFKGNDGSVWTFLEGGQSKGLFGGDAKLKGKKIKIDGSFYYTAHHINVDNYSFLED